MIDSHRLASTMSKMSPHLGLELRHVSASHLAQLSTIIDEAKAWKDLLNELAVPLNLSLESIHCIKRQQNSDKSPTLALLNHWSITGRRRPTIDDLIRYLRLCRLARAEDYVRRVILNEPPLEQVIGEPVMPKVSDPQIEAEFTFQELSSVTSRISECCPRYSFRAIYESTNRFCHRPYDPASSTGARIGDGRFSSVFLARTYEETASAGSESRPTSSVVAAKLLKSECNMNYLVNEIQLARKIDHESILELRGISVGLAEDGQARHMCLIYPYMQNGSLLDCLKHGLRCNKMQQIPWRSRVDIATKVARGIEYLHTHPDGVIIHRDIKTANILIDSNLNPKLGDFTLVRQLDSRNLGDTQHSQNVIGTSVYMPPEAFRGDISTKFDIFSFGIVMLELITGLRPFNEDTNEDLLTYISDKLSDIEEPHDKVSADRSADERYGQFLLDIMDRRAGSWAGSVLKSLFKMSMKATEARKRDRPEARDILEVLNTLFTT